MMLYSYYLKHANTEFEWGPFDDSYETFLINLKENPNDRCLQYYSENPITYKTNNYGFRSPDDIAEGFDGNLYLGCSHTYGLGHYWENTWVSLLNEKIGGKCLNLGVPGTGIGTGARILNKIKGLVKPKNIFCHYIHPYRYEYWDWVGKNWRTISPAFKNKSFDHHAPVPKEMLMYLAEEEYMRAYYRSNFALVKDIARQLNAKLHSVPLVTQQALKRDDRYVIKNDTPLPHKSRDLQHHNIMWHRNLADRFFKAYLDNEPIDEFPAEPNVEYFKNNKPVTSLPKNLL